MLEFSSFFNAHFHLFSKKTGDKCSELLKFSKHSYKGLCSATKKEEFFALENFINKNNLMEDICLSYGIHPWYADISGVPFVEELIIKNKIKAIGEIGFDFYFDEIKEKKKEQEECWSFQIELAKKHQIPIVIHCNKAFDFILKDKKTLGYIPSVIFHGFNGSEEQSLQLLKNIPQCYFSFGSLVLNKSRKILECITKIPESRILLETDDKSPTLLKDIYNAVYEIKKSALPSFSAPYFENLIKQNYHNAFYL